MWIGSRGDGGAAAPDREEKRKRERIIEGSIIGWKGRMKKGENGCPFNFKAVRDLRGSVRLALT
jgi:hypothetical protein